MPEPDRPTGDPHHEDLEEAVADPIDGYDPPVISAREAARRGMAGFPLPGGRGKPVGAKDC